MADSSKIILLIGIRTLLSELEGELRALDFTIKGARNIEIGRKLVSHAHPALIIIATSLEDGSAFDMLTSMHEKNQSCPIILVSKNHALKMSLDKFAVVSQTTPIQTVVDTAKQLIKNNPAPNPFSLDEFMQLIKLTRYSTEISICLSNDKQKEFGNITILDGKVCSSFRGDYEGVEALKRLLSARDLILCFKEIEHKKEDNVDPEWTNKFFQVTDSDPAYDTPTRPISKSVTGIDEGSPRSTIGHGTGGVPFMMFSNTKNETRADTQAIPKSKASNYKQTRTENMGIGELLDNAMEAILERDYELAEYILTTVLTLDPNHRTAKANLQRIQQISQGKE